VSTSTMERRQPVGPGVRLDDRALREMRREQVRTEAPLSPRGAPGVRRPEDPNSGRVAYSPRPQLNVPPSPAEIARPSFGRDGQPRGDQPRDRRFRDDSGNGRGGPDRSNGAPISSTHSNPAAGLIVNPPQGTVTTRPASPQPWHGDDRRGGRDNDRDRDGQRDHDRGRDDRRFDNGRANMPQNNPQPVRPMDPVRVNPPPNIGRPNAGLDAPRSPQAPQPQPQTVPQPRVPEMRAPEMRERPGNGGGGGNGGGMRRESPQDDRRGGGGGGDDRRFNGQPNDRGSAR
jgi:hypothetical protein